MHASRVTSILFRSTKVSYSGDENLHASNPMFIEIVLADSFSLLEIRFDQGLEDSKNGYLEVVLV